MKYTLHTKTKEIWELILIDIGKAEKTILLDNYILSDLKKGQIGEQIVSALQDAVNRGVRVDLILDAFGSLELWRKAKTLLNGIEVRFYNDRPRVKHKFVNIFLRDHRKLVVIDSTITHIGGVVFQQITEHWNDFHARILDTKIANEASLIFSHHKLKFLDRKTKRIRKKFFLVHDMDLKRGEIYKELMLKISKAKKEIIIQTPYLSLPFLMQRRLKKAVERGVSVRILFPQKSDSRIATTVAWRQAEILTESGVKFYAQKTTNHGKVVLIDDWITFGSCNLDRLSLHWNSELNIQFKKSRIVKDSRKILVNWIDESSLIEVKYRSNFLQKAIYFFTKAIV